MSVILIDDRQADGADRQDVNAVGFEVPPMPKFHSSSYLRRSTQVYKWHRKKWSKGKGGSDIESNGKGGYIEHLQFRERRVHKSSKTWYSMNEERDYYLKSSKL